MKNNQNIDIVTVGVKDATPGEIRKVLKDYGVTMIVDARSMRNAMRGHNLTQNEYEPIKAFFNGYPDGAEKDKFLAGVKEHIFGRRELNELRNTLTDIAKGVITYEEALPVMTQLYGAKNIYSGDGLAAFAPKYETNTKLNDFEHGEKFLLGIESINKEIEAGGKVAIVHSGYGPYKNDIVMNACQYLAGKFHRDVVNINFSDKAVNRGTLETRDLHQAIPIPQSTIVNHYLPKELKAEGEGWRFLTFSADAENGFGYKYHNPSNVKLTEVEIRESDRLINGNFDYGRYLNYVETGFYRKELIAKNVKDLDMTVIFANNPYVDDLNEAKKQDYKSMVVRLSSERDDFMNGSVPDMAAVEEVGNRFIRAFERKMARQLNFKYPKTPVSSVGKETLMSLSVQMLGNSLSRFSHSRTAGTVTEDEANSTPQTLMDLSQFSAKDTNNIFNNGTLSLDQPTDVTQDDLNVFMTAVIDYILHQPLTVSHKYMTLTTKYNADFDEHQRAEEYVAETLTMNISNIITLGNTGVEEGIDNAILSLNIPHTVFVPKGYTLNHDNDTLEGKMLSDRPYFLNRHRQDRRNDVTDDELRENASLQMEKLLSPADKEKASSLSPKAIAVLQDLNFTDADIIQMETLAAEEFDHIIESTEDITSLLHKMDGMSIDTAYSRVERFDEAPDADEDARLAAINADEEVASLLHGFDIEEVKDIKKQVRNGQVISTGFSLKDVSESLVAAASRRVERRFANAAAAGVAYLVPGDTNYPKQFAAMPVKPQGLWYRGDASILNGPTVGLFGTFTPGQETVFEPNRTKTVKMRDEETGEYLRNENGEIITKVVDVPGHYEYRHVANVDHSVVTAAQMFGKQVADNRGVLVIDSSDGPSRAAAKSALNAGGKVVVFGFNKERDDDAEFYAEVARKGGVVVKTSPFFIEHPENDVYKTVFEDGEYRSEKIHIPLGHEFRPNTDYNFEFSSEAAKNNNERLKALIEKRLVAVKEEPDGTKTEIAIPFFGNIQTTEERSFDFRFPSDDSNAFIDGLEVLPKTVTVFRTEGGMVVSSQSHDLRLGEEPYPDGVRVFSTVSVAGTLAKLREIHDKYLEAQKKYQAALTDENMDKDERTQALLFDQSSLPFDKIGVSVRPSDLNGDGVIADTELSRLADYLCANGGSVYMENLKRGESMKGTAVVMYKDGFKLTRRERDAVERFRANGGTVYNAPLQGLHDCSLILHNDDVDVAGIIKDPEVKKLHDYLLVNGGSIYRVNDANLEDRRYFNVSPNSQKEQLCELASMTTKANIIVSGLNTPAIRRIAEDKARTYVVDYQTAEHVTNGVFETNGKALANGCKRVSASGDGLDVLYKQAGIDKIVEVHEHLTKEFAPVVKVVRYTDGINEQFHCFVPSNRADMRSAARYTYGNKCVLHAESEYRSVMSSLLGYDHPVPETYGYNYKGKTAFQPICIPSVENRVLVDNLLVSMEDAPKNIPGLAPLDARIRDAKMFRQIQEGARALQRVMQSEVQMGDAAAVHFSHAIHLAISDNDVRVYEGDRLRARTYIDTKGRLVLKNENNDLTADLAAYKKFTNPIFVTAKKTYNENATAEAGQKLPTVVDTLLERHADYVNTKRTYSGLVQDVLNDLEYVLLGSDNRSLEEKNSFIGSGQVDNRRMQQNYEEEITSGFTKPAEDTLVIARNDLDELDLERGQKGEIILDQFFLTSEEATMNLWSNLNKRLIEETKAVEAAEEKKLRVNGIAEEHEDAFQELLHPVSQFAATSRNLPELSEVMLAEALDNFCDIAIGMDEGKIAGAIETVKKYALEKSELIKSLEEIREKVSDINEARKAVVAADEECVSLKKKVDATKASLSVINEGGRPYYSGKNRIRIGKEDLDLSMVKDGLYTQFVKALEKKGPNEAKLREQFDDFKKKFQEYSAANRESVANADKLKREEIAKRLKERVENYAESCEICPSTANADYGIVSRDGKTAVVRLSDNKIVSPFMPKVTVTAKGYWGYQPVTRADGTSEMEANLYSFDGVAMYPRGIVSVNKTTDGVVIARTAEGYNIMNTNETKFVFDKDFAAFNGYSEGWFVVTNKEGRQNYVLANGEVFTGDSEWFIHAEPFKDGKAVIYVETEDGKGYEACSMTCNGDAETLYNLKLDASGVKDLLSRQASAMCISRTISLSGKPSLSESDQKEGVAQETGQKDGVRTSFRNRLG